MDFFARIFEAFSIRSNRPTVEDIVALLIRRGEILPQHRGDAIKELDQELRKRTVSVVRRLAGITGRATGATSVIGALFNPKSPKKKP